MAELDRNEVVAALRQANGNISRAAKILGCSRVTIQARMREYGLARGKAGRPKRRLPYGRRRRGYLAAGAAAAGVLGYLLLRKGSST